MAKSPKGKKSVKTTTKQKSNSSVSRSGPRKLKAPEPKFPNNIWPFRKGKHPKIPHAPLPPAYKILQNSLRVLSKNWGLFAGIAAIYAVLELIFVRGFALADDLGPIKADFTNVFHGHIGSASGGLGQFVSLLYGTNNSANQSAGIYQFFVIIIGSLAIIWTIRQLYSGVLPKIRDGWYRGTYPIVPIFLILVLIAVELIPFIFAVTLVVVANDGEIATTALERFVVIVIGLGLASLTIRWLSTSLFALYIATLPEITPVVALRTAADLVRHRRVEVVRKVGFLPIVLFIASVIVMTPIILFATALASWAFFLLTVIWIPIIHSYMYATYRELL